MGEVIDYLLAGAICLGDLSIPARLVETSEFKESSLLETAKKEDFSKELESLILKNECVAEEKKDLVGNSKEKKSKKSRKNKSKLETVLKKNKKSTDKKLSEGDSEKVDEEQLIDDLEESDEGEFDAIDLLDYSALERHFLIEKLSYGAAKEGYLAKFGSEIFNPYESEETVGYEMRNSATMDGEEARDTIHKIMAESVVGGQSDVSYDDKRRLSTWITFNNVLFKLYESTGVIQGANTDYRTL